MSQVTSYPKNEWLCINDEYASSCAPEFSLKISGVQQRRDERKFSPISKPKATTSQGGRFQSVNPSSLWTKNQTSVDNWMPRQPTKITSTKPDIDLLFSLFSVIDSVDERENSDSELDRSLSPHSSPNLSSHVVHSHLQLPSHLQSHSMVSNGVSAAFPVFPSQQDVLPLHSHTVGGSGAYQFQPYIASSHSSVYNSDSFAASPSSYITDEDYSVLDSEVVNSYDPPAWLLPVFDNKLMEKAVPFSELVDNFCL